MQKKSESDGQVDCDYVSGLFMRRHDPLAKMGSAIQGSIRISGVGRTDGGFSVTSRDESKATAAPGGG
jgi:hypothetical protein